MFKGLFKFVVLFILFVTAAGAASFVTLTYIIGSEESVVVPDLVGRDVIYVLETLSTMELNTKVKGSEFSPRIPRNRVIVQDPAPGTRIKRGRDVRIVFSRGPQMMAMPSLKHLSLAEAKIRITEMGLEFGVTSTLFHPGIDKEAVITHVPEPGAQVTRGAKVDLLLSDGKKSKTLIMADLTGKALDEALERIETMGLKVGTIISESAASAEPNSVLAQSPAPGFQVLQGLTVDITINRSPRPDSETTRPGVTGSRLFTWRVDEGFLKKRVKVQLVGDHHTVLAQSPAPGFQVLQGLTVDITINRSPRPESETTRPGVTGSRLFTWRVDEGFLKKRVKVQLVGDHHTDTVLDRDALPGEELWVLIPTFERSTLFLYEDGHLKETRFFD